MRREPVVLLVLSCATALHAEPDASGSATLPLAEIMRLRDAAARSQTPEKPAPPVGAVVTRLDMTGRILDDAMEVVARAELIVLATGSWVVVPLLRKDAELELVRASAGTEGAVAVRDGQLAWVTEQRGVHTVEMVLQRRARKAGRTRRVSWDGSLATASSLRVSADDGLFRLVSTTGPREAEGVRIPGDRGVYVVEWETAVDGPARLAVAPAAPVEPVVTMAHASAVSTLEGGVITRVRYDLRFSGRRAFQLVVPPGQALEKVFINGVAVPVKPEGAEVALDVTPPRAGDEGGLLEVVLVSPRKAYNLSGARSFELPRVSWPVNEVFLDVHLPEVFGYEWSGGSLAPADESPETTWTYKVPTPGRCLRFHQYLVLASAPRAEVSYSVDMDGKYFRR